MWSRVLLIAGLPGLLAMIGPAAPARALTVGIADQSARTFHAERFKELPIRDARVTVPWDALRHRYQRRELDDWMEATQALNIEPLVTFGPSRVKTGRLPSVAAYAAQTRAFRRRYPLVRQYSPWNEPNTSVRKQGNDPARIAAYYRTLRAGCKRCTLLGIDVVDNSTMDDWLRAYVKQFPLGRIPRLWGLHNYIDANALPLSSWGTRTMLSIVPGEVWFTETGAIYRRRTPTLMPGRPDRRGSIVVRPGRSRQIMERIFRLARLHKRVTRVYVYHGRPDDRSSWDSALLTEAGTPRPSFEVFRDEAFRWAAAQE